MSKLSLEQRVRLLEIALSEIQSFGGGAYLGLCVNAQLDNEEHPHWDDYHIALAVRASEAGGARAPRAAPAQPSGPSGVRQRT